MVEAVVVSASIAKLLLVMPHPTQILLILLDWLLTNAQGVLVLMATSIVMATLSADWQPVAFTPDT
jgi:hypothetical protein